MVIDKNDVSCGRKDPSNRFWFSAVLGSLTCALWIAPALAASTALPTAQIDKLALGAYCTEAQHDQQPLQDGQVSYKKVADLASKRALAEHPNVYKDPNAWKAKIVALLDQYGDEPTTQLCQENPSPHS
jgi:hypothetical protein